MKIGITGHRPPRLNGHEKNVADFIRTTLEYYKPEEFWNGMAQGADQIGANEALTMGIPVVCVYPFKKNYFHPEEQKIISAAKKTEFLFENYNEHKKQTYWLRDKYIVDNVDLLIAIFDGNKVGGTWITVDYAIKKGMPVVFIPEWELKK